MKEILYIQAGTLPNFAGTHFWNTQESYFQYFPAADAAEADEPGINHCVSYREGLSPKVRLKSLGLLLPLKELNASCISGYLYVLPPPLDFR